MASSIPDPSLIMAPTFQSWLRSFPPITFLTFFTLWFVHCFRVITGFLSPLNFDLTSRIDSPGELYRLFTGPLLHADLFHLTLNSMALYALGLSLETSLGTTLYFLVQTFCIFAGSGLYVLILTVAILSFTLKI